MKKSNQFDEKYMREALIEAKRAAEKNEVPIGAVAVIDETVVARAHNIREATHDPLGHAELLLLMNVAHQQQMWRLEDVTLYVTCEPCLMCAGAILQARVPRLVFGCFDPKAGACGSLYHVLTDQRLNHQVEVIGGVLADECGLLLTTFFQRLRQR